MNQKQFALACAMLLQGSSVAMVATRLRLTSSDVYRMLADSGRSVRDLRAARRKAIAYDLDQGVTIADLMEKYGASRAYVRDVAKEQE